MPADLQTYDSGGTALSSVTFSSTVKGTPSAAVAFRLQNDGDAEATEPAIIVKQLDADNVPVEEGLRAINEHWLEIRWLGTGSSGSDQQLTGWMPVGRGRPMFAEPLSPGEYHDGEARYAPPESAPDGQVDFEFFGEASLSGNTTILGISDHGRDGVISGLGDDTHSELVRFSGLVENPAGVDDNVSVPDLIGVVAGDPVVVLDHLEQLDANDGSGTPLSSGDEYKARFSVSSSGVNVTKSDLYSSGDPDPPDVPVGEINLGWVRRQFDGLIGDDDITQQHTEGRWQFSSSADVATLGPGKAHIRDHLLNTQAARNLTLPLSTTGNRIWIIGEKTVTLQTTTDDTPPEDRAYKAYQVDTDGSGILEATLEDFRDPIDVDVHQIIFRFDGAITGGEKAYAPWPFMRDGWVRQPNGIWLSASGNGSGNTTGELRADIHLGVGGTSLFTSQGTDDRRPDLQWDASSPFISRDALPEVLKIDRKTTVLECELSLTYDGTGPDNVVVVMLVELP